MTSPLETVIAIQQALIAALDARDVSGIETATAGLQAALCALKSDGAVHADAATIAKLGHARKQSEAARIRINVHADWTRQRIDRLAELRGGGPALHYRKPPVSRSCG
jgi:hypothetical protein